MSYIESNIIIDLPDNVDPTPIIEQLRRILSTANGKDTATNVVEVDNPVSTNIIYAKNLGE